jgi:hypothetical protein
MFVNILDSIQKEEPSNVNLSKCFIKPTASSFQINADLVRLLRNNRARPDYISHSDVVIQIDAELRKIKIIFVKENSLLIKSSYKNSFKCILFPKRSKTSYISISNKIIEQVTKKYGLKYTAPKSIHVHSPAPKYDRIYLEEFELDLDNKVSTCIFNY